MSTIISRMSEQASYIILLGDNILLKKDELNRPLITHPSLEELKKSMQLDLEKAVCIKLMYHKNATLYLVSQESVPEFNSQVLACLPIKIYLDEASVEDQAIILRTLHIRNWYKNTHYCETCGGGMKLASDELFAKSCDQGHKRFISYYPAIIAMVTRKDEHGEDQILLARKYSFAPNWYTHVAGFVDPGEDFTSAVKREVLEETGIEVTDIEYVGDQSWPFPSGLMVAFKASALSKEIVIDHAENEDIRWFTKEEAKKIPWPKGTTFSLSKKLLDSFINMEEKASQKKSCEDPSALSLNQSKPMQLFVPPGVVAISSGFYHHKNKIPPFVIKLPKSRFFKNIRYPLVYTMVAVGASFFGGIGINFVSKQKEKQRTLASQNEPLSTNPG